MNEWEERQQWLKKQREQLGELFELENFRLKAYPYEGQKGLALNGEVHHQGTTSGLQLRLPGTKGHVTAATTKETQELRG